MVDWSLLPKELLDLIAERMSCSFDLLRFRSVCSSWRSSIWGCSHSFPGRFPFLTNDGFSDTTWGFNLSKRTIFLIRAPRTRSPTNPDAWLVKVEESAIGRMKLMNPLSRFKIEPLPDELPKLLNISEFPMVELGQEYVLHYMNFQPLNFLSDVGSLYMEKLLFMRLDSQTDDFVLLTIHVSGKLAMFKSGDKRWTIIHDMPSPYDDVIIFNNEFYAVDNTGRAVMVDLNSTLSGVAEPVFGGDKKFLVESQGELLLVDMYLSMVSDQDLGFSEEFDDETERILYERTARFDVFKHDEKGKQWLDVKCLGDRVLFLADDSTFSGLASDLAICKGNCIFFTDNFFYTSGEEDGVFKGRVGVYDLDDGRISSLTDHPKYSKLFWPPPNWFRDPLTGPGVEEENHTSNSLPPSARMRSGSAAIALFIRYHRV